jgi:hypothetical protein
MIYMIMQKSTLAIHIDPCLTQGLLLFWFQMQIFELLGIYGIRNSF